jgi:hypothetical protein
MKRFARNLLLALTLIGGNVVSAQTELPPAPPVKSPVDIFRELLDLSTAERAHRLTNYSETARARLLEKVSYYQALSPEEREVRLLATELRWWLMPLMQQAEPERTKGLQLVPERLRKLVAGRLEMWAMVPPQLQQEMLDNEGIAQKFAQFQGSTASQQAAALQALSEADRKMLQAGLERWSAMSAEQRRLTCEQFGRYFELSPRERQKILGTLSEAERRQMEQTLASFANLPPKKRQACVRSFEKFASMSVAERKQFLQNAQRWEKMSQTERDTWRNLVSRVPEFPPLPPGFGAPPMPPSLRPGSPASPATNSGG